MSLSQSGDEVSGTMRIRDITTWRVDGQMVSPLFGLPTIPPTAGPLGDVEGQVERTTLSWVVELGSQTCEYTASLSLQRDKMEGTGSCTDADVRGYRAEITFDMELLFLGRPPELEAVQRSR